MAKQAEQRKAVASYLGAIEASKGPGRKRTIERIMEEKGIAEQTMADTLDPIRKLETVQAILSLNAEAEAIAKRDPEQYKADFITHAAEFASERNITPTAFMRMGVPRSVLQAAGML